MAFGRQGGSINGRRRKAVTPKRPTALKPGKRNFQRGDKKTETTLEI